MNEFKEIDKIRFSQIPLNNKKGTVSRQTVNPRGSSNTTMPLYKNKLIMKEKGCIVGVKTTLRTGHFVDGQFFDEPDQGDRHRGHHQDYYPWSL